MQNPEGRLSWQELEKLVNALGGVAVARKVLSGESVVCGRQRLWKTLALGRFDTWWEYAGEIKAAGMSLTVGAEEVRDTLRFQEQPIELDLAVWTAHELGFSRGGLLGDIYSAAASRGLTRCPQETGLALRLEYLTQPDPEHLMVASDELVDSRGENRIFCLTHFRGQRYLTSYSPQAEQLWSPSTRFVFARSWQCAGAL